MKNWLNVLETHINKRVVVNSEVDSYLIENGFNCYSGLVLTEKLKLDYEEEEDDEENSFVKEVKNSIIKYNKYFRDEERVFVLKSSIIINGRKYNIRINVLSNRLLIIVGVKNKLPVIGMKILIDSILKTKLSIENDISELLHNVMMELSSLEEENK